MAKERQKGIWLYKKITDDYHVIGQCSVCKERSRINSYCPFCGAKMTTEKEKDNSCTN